MIDLSVLLFAVEILLSSLAIWLSPVNQLVFTHSKFSNGCHLKMIQDTNKLFVSMIDHCVLIFVNFFIIFEHIKGIFQGGFTFKSDNFHSSCLFCLSNLLYQFPLQIFKWLPFKNYARYQQIPW